MVHRTGAAVTQKLRSATYVFLKGGGVTGNWIINFYFYMLFQDRQGNFKLKIQLNRSFFPQAIKHCKTHVWKNGVPRM